MKRKGAAMDYDLSQKKHGRRRRLPWLVAITVLALAAAMAGPPAAQAASPLKVTVTIHHIWEVHCDDNDSVLGDTCGNDYYAKVFFPDGERTSPRAADDLTEVEPNWQLSGTVDRDAGPFGVRIQLWDHDSTSGPDLIDIAPGDSNLDITIDPNTGDFSGDVPTANIGYATGTGDDAAALFFSVTFGDTVDFDGDGLHDGIERSAIVADKNGTIPDHGALRALTANGSPTPVSASPCRPTILVEIDYMDGPDGPDPDTDPDHTHRPKQDALNEAVAAFAAGAVPATAGCPYSSADKSGGVQLLTVVDDALSETDKLDWASGPGGVTGKSIRKDNFDPALRPYFHYSLWVHNQPDAPASPGGPPVVNDSSGLCCSDSGKDVLVSLGQWDASVGTVRDQSGSFMHELGHALGLGHGGGDKINCKPNYHSIMSYVYQTTGIPDASLPPPTVDLNDDGTIDGRDRLRLDYSRVALKDLDEDALDEGDGIGAGPDTFLWDGDGSLPWRSSAGNVAVDWDRDVPTNIDAGTVSADVNFMGIPGSQGCPMATLPPGTKGTPELYGYKDWDHLQYKGPLSPPSSGVAVTSSEELDKSTADYIRAAVREAMSLTDMEVRLTDTPDPVGAGAQLTYGLDAHNRGATNTAYSVKIEQTLPEDVTFVSASPGCSHAAGTVTCLVGNVAPGATASATVKVSVPADLVYKNGGPKNIASTAKVSHDGPDPDTANNSATATTRVVAMADVKITDVKGSGPLEVLIGQPAQISLETTVENGGPSTPIDAVQSTTATAGGGVVVTPPASTQDVRALAVGSPRTVGSTAQVECRSPGAKTVTLVSELALKNAEDVDPDTSNNRRTTEFRIDCVVPIAINIRPGGFPNSINLNTDATLAALTTRAGEYGLPLDFTAIDVSATLWGLRENLFNTATPTGAREIHGIGHPERSYELDERTRDSDLDLVLHFKPDESGLRADSTQGCLKGKYTAPDGHIYTFFGCDSIRIVGS
jgi:hypothetical protein